MEKREIKNKPLYGVIIITIIRNNTSTMDICVVCMCVCQCSAGSRRSSLGIANIKTLGCAFIIKSNMIENRQQRMKKRERQRQMKTNKWKRMLLLLRINKMRGAIEVKRKNELKMTKSRVRTKTRGKKFNIYNVMYLLCRYIVDGVHT